MSSGGGGFIGGLTDIVKAGAQFALAPIVAPVKAAIGLGGSLISGGEGEGFGARLGSAGRGALGGATEGITDPFITGARGTGTLLGGEKNVFGQAVGKGVSEAETSVQSITQGEDAFKARDRREFARASKSANEQSRLRSESVEREKREAQATIDREKRETEAEERKGFARGLRRGASRFPGRRQTVLTRRPTQSGRSTFLTGLS